MKILHLISDSLFTNYVIDLFEDLNRGNNDFLISVPNSKRNLSFTNSDFDTSIIICDKNSAQYFRQVESSDADVIIVHCLHNYKANIVSKLKKKPNQLFVWFAWGTDLSWIPGFHEDLYHSHTKRIMSKLSFHEFSNMKGFVKKLYHYVCRGYFNRIYLKAVEKFDYCSTVMPEEFISIKKLIPNHFHAKNVFFSYATLERSFGHTLHNVDFKLGSSVLIGNSASPASNHIDVFLKYASEATEKRKIIVPLNYGEYSSYIKIVLKKGHELFSENFMPLTNLVLKKEEYIELLKNCNIAIMLHERQQALGNLIILIWLGIKVFLSENSPVYEFFIKKNVKVYSFQREFNSMELLGLSEADVTHNRNTLYEIYGETCVKAKLSSTLDIFCKHSQ